MTTLINFLGENIYETEKINEVLKTYITLIKEIKKQKIDASLSVKLTQIGLCKSYKTALRNYLEIVSYARENSIFVWIDMETPQYVNDTIKAYKMAVKYGNAGITIQSYLKRSGTDLEELVRHRAKIRLVKGAYKTKPGVAFRSKRQINHNYMQMMRMLFKNSDDFEIATHDSRIIEEAEKLNKKYKRRVTYAMLNGIRNRYAKYLANHGNNVAVYVPFGSDWIGFAYRRLVEQRHLTLIIRSLFEKQGI